MHCPQCMNKMQECMKKWKGKEKCYLEVMAPVVVRLVQAFLPNQNNVEFQGTTFDDLFLIYSYIIPNIHRIMKNLDIKSIPVIRPILKYHLRVIMVNT